MALSTPLPAEQVGCATSRVMVVDQNGNPVGTSAGATRRTYRGAISVTLAALATDFFDIFGSAASTVVVRKLRVNGVQTAAGKPEVHAIKRGAASTGGTAVAMTAVPLDSASAAAGAAPNGYSANRSALGAAVGTIARRYVPLTPAATAFADGTEFDFGPAGVTLRGIAEGLALNLGGVTVTGGVVDIEAEWEEF
jgi:hypothetical protein